MALPVAKAKSAGRLYLSLVRIRCASAVQNVASASSTTSALLFSYLADDGLLLGPTTPLAWLVERLRQGSRQGSATQRRAGLDLGDNLRSRGSTLRMWMDAMVGGGGNGGIPFTASHSPTPGRALRAGLVPALLAIFPVSSPE